MARSLGRVKRSLLTGTPPLQRSAKEARLSNRTLLAVKIQEGNHDGLGKKARTSKLTSQLIQRMHSHSAPPAPYIPMRTARAALALSR